MRCATRVCEQKRRCGYRFSFVARSSGTFFVDIIVEGAVLVEIKALPELDARSVGQLLNYLKVAGGGVGLLLNFGRRPEVRP